MERAAPSNLNYQDVLPIAISSKAQTRSFFPEGGAIYGPNGGSKPSVVRIPVSADSFLDGPNSYFRMDLKNTATHGAAPAPTALKLGMDYPQSFIQRVRILSGDGTVIEDINEYGRLYAGILYPSQASQGMYSEGGITNAQSDFYKSTTDTTGSSPSLTSVTLTKAEPLHNGVTVATGAIANAATAHLCFNLAAGFLNLSKFVPLPMLSSGFIVELSFGSPGSAGVYDTGVPNADAWEISNIRYEAHLVSLDREFGDRLRMVMEASGGVLQLASSTYRHFSGQWGSAATAVTINCPVRAKSIKSILFKNTIEADVVGNAKFGVSSGCSHGIESFQFRVGSVAYPSSPVDCGAAAANKSIPYMELRKAFGTLNDYLHGSPLAQKGTYLSSATASAAAGASGIVGPLGYSFDSFPSTALESGTNSAANSLVTTLELKGAVGATTATTVDIYAMCDMMVYVNLDGSVSVSV
mgnify:FL=1